jgi:acyl-CoA thioesterase FadM
MCPADENVRSWSISYTVNLNVIYKKLLTTPQVVLVLGRVAKKEGRKLQMKGSFEVEKGEKFAEAEGLWIMMEKNVGSENVKSKL